MATASVSVGGPLLGTSDLALSLISAGSAVAGAVVGGVITGLVTLRSERARQEFARETARKKEQSERDQEAAIARGAARIMRTHFNQAGTILAKCVERRQWWPQEILLEPLPPLEDRKLLASLLTTDEWTAVEEGEFNLQLVITRRSLLSTGRAAEEVIPYDDQSHEATKTAALKMEGAIQALARLASERR